MTALQRIETEQGDWIQAWLLPLEGSTASEALSRVLRDFIGEPRLTLAVRVDFADAKVLRTSVSVAAPLDLRSSVTGIAACFQAADGGGSAFPRYQVRAAGEPQGVRPWFSPAFRVWSNLEWLLLESARSDGKFSYQAHVRWLGDHRAAAAAAARNLLEIRDSAGVSAELLELQTQLSDRLRQPCFDVEEYLGVPESVSSEWVETSLKRAFRLQFEKLGFGVQRFAMEAEAYSGFLDAGLHSHFAYDAEPSELCAGAAEPDEVRRLFAQLPVEGERHAPRIRPRVAGSSEPRLPEPRKTEAPYAFVSYAHRDSERIRPVLGQLSERGIPLWYDSGLNAGFDWQAQLADQLRDCGVFLLFLSQEAMNSTYVQDEIYFARKYNRPILPVKMGELTWNSGIEMVVSPYQMIDETHPDIAGEIARFLRQRLGP